MKKLIVMTLGVVMGFIANAAVVNWGVNGTAETENYTVYVLTGIADSYGSVADLADAAIASASIVKSGRNYSTGTQKIEGSEVTKTADYFYAIVSGNDATSFNYLEAAGLASKVYDPAAQESSPGAFNTITAANILAGSSKSFSGTPGPVVPEPTSGLLLLVGMAGLALRRKQK